MDSSVVIDSYNVVSYECLKVLDVVIWSATNDGMSDHIYDLFCEALCFPSGKSEEAVEMRWVLYSSVFIAVVDIFSEVDRMFN